MRALIDGYVQYVDMTGLLKHAKEKDVFIKLISRPSDFGRKEQVIARVGFRAHATEDVLQGAQRAVVIGGYKSPHQDVLFVVNRLVEVAGRALSPGVNDIFTATNAMDWLGEGLSNLAGRAIPEDLRRDEAGQPRIDAPSRTFDEIACAVFDQLRPCVAADRNAALHLLNVLAAVAGRTDDRSRRALLLSHAKALRDAAVSAIHHPRDIALIEDAYSTTVAPLGAPRVREPRHKLGSLRTV